MARRPKPWYRKSRNPVSPDKADDLLDFEEERISVDEFELGEHSRFELLENRRINLKDGSVQITYEIASYIRDDPTQSFADIKPSLNASRHSDMDEVCLAEKARELFAKRNEKMSDIDQLDNEDLAVSQKRDEFRDDLTAAKEWLNRNHELTEKQRIEFERQIAQKLPTESLDETQSIKQQRIHRGL